MKNIIGAVVKEATWIGKQAIDFSTKEQMDAYMKEHPDADPHHHRVVEKKEDHKEDLQNKIEEKNKNLPTEATMANGKKYKFELDKEIKNNLSLSNIKTYVSKDKKVIVELNDENKVMTARDKNDITERLNKAVEDNKKLMQDPPKPHAVGNKEVFRRDKMRLKDWKFQLSLNNSNIRQYKNELKELS